MKKWLSLLLAAVLALSLAACGGGSGGTEKAGNADSASCDTNTKKTGYAYNFYIAQNTGHDCYVAFSARMSCAFSVRCVKIQ